jgi:soluble lytic murein transglycosylase
MNGSFSKASRILPTVMLVIAGTLRLRGDIVSIPISADLDAEFAHAADLLEAGDRAKAEQALNQIQNRSGQTAWKARVAMLLAFDDERHGNWGSAARLLSDAPAAAIGLEPYRRLHLARALSHLGQWERAERELAQSFDSDEAFVSRPEAALELARLREKRGRRAEALAVLERAFSTVAPDDAAAIGEERIRMSLAAGNPASARAAAADLVAAGVDATSARGRRAVADELARSTPAVRARFARARIAAGDARRGVALLRADSPARWPPEERAANLLALAHGLARLRRGAEAEKVAARILEDGTPASFEARLEQADLALARLRRKKAPVNPQDPRLLAARRMLAGLLSDSTPEPVRSAARDRLIRIAGERDEFDSGLAQARSLVREGSDASAGFEPLWKLAWKSYLGGDFETARSRLEQLTPLYPGISLERRLSYWTARCLEREGHAAEATAIFHDLAAAAPADVYALFARRRVPKFEARRPSPATDPSTATATFRRADELLRLRLFTDAAAEIRVLPRSRGRDLRLAEAEFALGRFPAAVSAAKRAFPEMGTAGEGRVPDPWRRLYYPIEEGGFLVDRAAEFGLEPALLRGLVRQESIFEAAARSRAGALGLTQLMPATARSIARSVLRQRYRKAFLYDPRINARLGAAYFRRLLDSFGGNPVYALAAYNGGPGRMERVLKENRGRSEDEVFESHPAFETRDYVRRVLLFAEAYRELYP